ncbi:tyrosine-type recombinase/integrase [Granulicella sp. dw_53]|uniref:tyrosine-type recombinase/integrase n=1 Tax=Granulicella sp. dw_53 TaxID=2719792 RepID=UPI001BD3EB8E|nr:tyrosine-type recombinase/integrase [Granulicella sp. dw_53]
MARKPKAVSGVFEKVPGSGIWYIRYRFDGKNVRRRIGSQSEAEAELAKTKLIKRGVVPGTVAKSAKEQTRTLSQIDGVQSGITINQLCEDYLAFISSPSCPKPPRDQSSPKQRVKAILEGFNGRSAASIKGYEIRNWLLSLNKKPATLNRYRSVLSSVYRVAMDSGKVDHNPVRDQQQFHVEAPDHPRQLRPEEEEAIRKVLDKWIAECPEHHRLRKLFLRCHPHELTLALGTGLRKSNQYNLKWSEHIDFDNRELHIPPAMNKTGKPQTIPMIDDVYEALQELRTIQEEITRLQDGERQRMSSDGRVFNIAVNREWWTDARNEAGIKQFRWHDLRHSFASRLVAAGVNLKIVQILCGHGSIATTQRYAHVDNEQMHEAMAKINRSRAA